MSSTHYYSTTTMAVWLLRSLLPHTLFILFYSVFVPLDGKQRWRRQYFPVMNLSWLSSPRYIYSLFCSCRYRYVVSTWHLNASTTISNYICTTISEKFLAKYIGGTQIRDGDDRLIKPQLKHQTRFYQICAAAYRNNARDW